MDYQHATPEQVLLKAREYLSKANVQRIEQTIRFMLQNEELAKPLQTGLDTAVPLLERQMGTPSVLAALTKEAIENQGLAKQVESEVVEIAVGAKKLDAIEEKNAGKLDSLLLSKLLLATSKDIRMMLVKIAGELREMRFLSEIPKEEQQQEPKTILEVFVPICHKLGLQKACWELEDLAMKKIYPTEYEQLKKMIPEKRAEREKKAELFKGQIQQVLQKDSLAATALGRAKNFYRIHKKMQEKNLKPEEIHDLIAARVICNTVEECYRALNIIQNSFKSVSGPIEDFIAHPKPNGYQSIHVDVEWQNKPCEIQIRTWKMHTEAEDGLAAHWEYKKYVKDKSFDSQLSITKQMADWMETQPNKQILETLRIQFEKNKLFVFTPKNEVIELPEKATPIDFAYALHSSLGNKCEKANVNGKLVPLHHALETGDTIEIITSEKQQPKRNWLSFVVTDKAQSKIRQALQMEQTGLKKGTKKKFLIPKKRSLKPLLAKCCNPLPGDAIIAFKTTKRKIVIHQANCENAQKIPTAKRIEVSQEQFPKQPYNVEILVRATNQAGILAKALNEFARFECIINSTNTTTKSNQFSCRFNVQIKNTGHLEKLMERIRKIVGVQDCQRA